MIIGAFITQDECKRGLDFCGGLKPHKIYGSRSCVWRYGSAEPYSDNVASSTFPPYLTELAEDVTPILGKHPSQITVNRYKVGDSLGPHIDKGGEVICVLSLGEAEMKLGDEVLTLPNRSLLVLQGDDRWVKKHSILPVKAERHSIVFR